MNPYLILATVLVWGASVGGAFFYGQGIGADGEVAKRAAVDQAVRDTREAAQQGAAAAIAKLRPVYTTIRQETEREIRMVPQYSDCRHSPEQSGRINRALAGGVTPPADTSPKPSAHEDRADAPTQKR